MHKALDFIPSTEKEETKKKPKPVGKSGEWNREQGKVG
jgi:hypothetical protein